MNKIITKRGQEEIAGFMIIIVIVTIILLFLLVFSLRSNNESPVSYEASSFLQAALSYTTDCEIGSRVVDVEGLINACDAERRCSDERYSCDVLNQTLKDLIEESWVIGPEAPYKGYRMEAVSKTGENLILNLSAGNITNTFKGSDPQILPVTGVSVSFRAYS